MAFSMLSAYQKGESWGEGGENGRYERHAALAGPLRVWASGTGAQRACRFLSISARGTVGEMNCAIRGSRFYARCVMMDD